MRSEGLTAAALAPPLWRLPLWGDDGEAMGDGEDEAQTYLRPLKSAGRERLERHTGARAALEAFLALLALDLEGEAAACEAVLSYAGVEMRARMDRPAEIERARETALTQLAALSGPEAAARAARRAHRAGGDVDEALARRLGGRINLWRGRLGWSYEQAARRLETTGRTLRMHTADPGSKSHRLPPPRLMALLRAYVFLADRRLLDDFLRELEEDED